MRITLENGTTISDRPSEFGRLIILDHPDAPGYMRNIEAGRIVEMQQEIGFQPATFSAAGFTPATLRAIAQIIETEGA